MSTTDQTLRPVPQVLAHKVTKPRETNKWLVFPHELHGLTRQEILDNKPVDASFFDRG